MDPNDDQPPLAYGEPYPWMTHASWNSVPADELPSAPGPIIYEGFVPQNVSAYGLNTANSGFQADPATTTRYGQSRYPLPDSHPGEYDFDGGPVQTLEETLVPRFQGRKFTPAFNTLSRTTQQNYPALTDDENSIDEESAQEPLQTVSEETISDNPTATRSRGRGRGRGRGSGRGRARGSGSGRGPGRPKREERPRGGWNRGTKTGLRAVLDPGEEFNALHKEANEAFLDGQWDSALELILRAISINPEIYSAHVLLSDIYFGRGDEERGLAALFSGAHASPNDPSVWHQLADVCLQRESTDRPNMLKQASYCFQRLLQIDQDDHDARFQKAAISRELSHHAKAFKDLDYLLRKMPHNSSILRQIAEVCLDSNDVGRAIGLYDDALEYQKLNGASEETAFTWADLVVYVDLITRRDGLQSAMLTLKRLARWLMGREEEEFWDEIVQDDREWDATHERRYQISDFDPSRFSPELYGLGLPFDLRIKLGDLRLKNGNRLEAISHFDNWLKPEERDLRAPLHEYSDLFLQVADALHEVREFQHALRYYEALESIEACDDLEFWLGFGACSYVCEKKEQALTSYERAKDVDPTSGEARTQLSKLYAEKGERDKALVLARTAIRLYEDLLPETGRRKYERKDLREARQAAQSAYRTAYKIPKPQTEDGERPQVSKRAREKARRLAKEAAKKAAEEEEAARDTERAQSEGRDGSLSPPVRPNGLRGREAAQRQWKSKLNPQKEKSALEQRKHVEQLYLTLRGVTESMRERDDVSRNIWQDCAESLITEFRKEKIFYPGDRSVKFRGYNNRAKYAPRNSNDEQQEQAPEDVPLPSIESNIPNDFCGIAFAEWLDIFLEYAMLLANLQEDGSECYTVLKAAVDCNVWYHKPEALLQIHSCWLTCALALRDEYTLFNTVIRWFMREFLFCTDTFRLFGALNLYYPHSHDKGGKMGQMNNAAFRSGPNQKYLFRQIMGIDSMLPEDYGVNHPDGPVPDFMRKDSSAVFYGSDRLQRQNRVARLFQMEMETDMDMDLDNDENSPGTSRLPEEQNDDVVQRTFTPKELDVVLLTLYAQILYAGSSFPNALSYFYRAYTLEPKNPIILLSISLCYMHQMFKRQNENRHMYLLQGWSFFEEYADARTEWAEKKETEGWAGLVMVVKREIEFNRARCWQMLGMSDLAIRSYMKMLDMKVVKNEDAMDTGDGYGDIGNMEAAYSIANMYATNGDIDAARQITEKYLVV